AAPATFQDRRPCECRWDRGAVQRIQSGELRRLRHQRVKFAIQTADIEHEPLLRAAKLAAGFPPGVLVRSATRCGNLQRRFTAKDTKDTKELSQSALCPLCPLW